jgi:hypothetical protein
MQQPAEQRRRAALHFRQDVRVHVERHSYGHPRSVTPSVNSLGSPSGRQRPSICRKVNSRPGDEHRPWSTTCTVSVSSRRTNPRRSNRRPPRWECSVASVADSRTNVTRRPSVTLPTPCLGTHCSRHCQSTSDTASPLEPGAANRRTASSPIAGRQSPPLLFRFQRQRQSALQWAEARLDVQSGTVLELRPSV